MNFNGLFEKVRNLDITEQDTKKIKTKNPGILDIPSGKSFHSVPLKHYIDLAKSKGKGPVMKALNNLVRWNKKDDSGLSDKAKAIVDKLKDNQQWEKIGVKEGILEKVFTDKEVRDMPTISSGQTSNLKYDDGKTKVWVSRMTKEDGAKYDNAIEIEKLVKGVWQDVAELRPGSKVVVDDGVDEGKVDELSASKAVDLRFKHQELKKKKDEEKPEEMDEAVNEDYNGWTNWETWNVDLWMTNEEETQSMIASGQPYTPESAKELFLSVYPEGTPDFDEGEMENVNWEEVAKSWNKDATPGSPEGAVEARIPSQFYVNKKDFGPKQYVGTKEQWKKQFKQWFQDEPERLERAQEYGLELATLEDIDELERLEERIKEKIEKSLIEGKVNFIGGFDQIGFVRRVSEGKWKVQAYEAFAITDLNEETRKELFEGEVTREREIELFEDLAAKQAVSVTKGKNTFCPDGYLIGFNENRLVRVCEITESELKSMLNESGDFEPTIAWLLEKLEPLAESQRMAGSWIPVLYDFPVREDKDRNKYRKQADAIINSKEWSKDSQGALANKVIRLLVQSGMTEGEAYEYLEM